MYHGRFFDFAFAAVGSELTVYVNGRKILEAQDDESAEDHGNIAVGGARCTGLFRDIEVQVLDKSATTGMKPVPSVPSAGVQTPREAVPSRLTISNGSGKWQIEGDELIQSTFDRDTRLIFGDRTWKDYDFTVEAMRVAGNEDLSIMFRAEDMSHAYWMGFGTYGNRWYEVSSLDGSSGGHIGEQIPGSVQSNQWYTMLVKVRGQHCQGFLDGQCVLDFQDGRHLQGRVGLRTFRTTVRFRNIKVTAPDGKLLWEGMPDLP
jgi:eukaryotic-like serine/threonine-protein kinase